MTVDVPLKMLLEKYPTQACWYILNCSSVITLEVFYIYIVCYLGYFKEKVIVGEKSIIFSSFFSVIYELEDLLAKITPYVYEMSEYLIYTCEICRVQYRHPETIYLQLFIVLMLLCCFNQMFCRYRWETISKSKCEAQTLVSIERDD